MFFPRSTGTAVSILDTAGFIYFAQAVGGGLIKIGWATKPDVRLSKMQAHCPLTLKILLAVPGDGKMERRLHEQFAKSRRHGEWFEPIPDILAQIEAWRVKAPEPPIWPEKRNIHRITASGVRRANAS